MISLPNFSISGSIGNSLLLKIGVKIDTTTTTTTTTTNNNNNNINININNKSQQQQRLILKNFGGLYERTRVKSLPDGLDMKRRDR